MRRTLLLNYLYICALSILSQSSSGLARTANLTTSCSDGQVCTNKDHTVRQKPNEARMTDEPDQRIPHDSMTAKQTPNTVHRVRRKRELTDAADSVRLQGSSNPSANAGLTTRERRVRKSDHQMDRNSRKLVNKKKNADPFTEEDETQSGLKEARIKPKSRTIKESDSMGQKKSFMKEKLKVNESEGYEAGARRPESVNEQLKDEVDLHEKSAEYEATGDNDNDTEAPVRNAGYDKENDPEVSQTAEESDKLDVIQNSDEDDDFEGQEIAKRETGAAEEEYEDIADQDDTCEDADLIDESSYQQAKTRSRAGLLEKREQNDSRVKRHDIAAPSKFSLRSQAASEDQAMDGQAESEVKNGDEETSESKFRMDGRDTSNAGEQSDERLDKGRNGSGDPISDYVKKEAADVKDDSKSSVQDSSLGVFAKDNGLDSDYEKTVEEQIQQKIESIKEEIKREVEEKQRVWEIEANNAKYDEIQSEIEEDEDEDSESLDVPNERQSFSKRSIVDGTRSPQAKTKRHILRRIKRSDTTDAQQLRAIEGVEKLDPDVLTKAQLRHESIRKRAAPVYGAVDKDASDTSRPLMKRSANPRRAYLVSNDRKASPTPRGREVRNDIIIPEQAHVNIEDELPPGLSLDPKLLEDPFSPTKYRLKRSPDRFARGRRASAVIPEGRVAFLGYRPQDDDENDEGSEFHDDGFEDRTSNLRQDKSYGVPQAPTHDQYHGDEPRDENPSDFLFAGVDHGRDDYWVRRKRAGIRDDEEPDRLHGGGALGRRQIRAKAKQMQVAQITSRKSVMDRDKRHAGKGVDETKSDSVASLVGSSQELSPRLETEYREAFGGLQNDPGGALARFKRVKRNVLRDSLD